MRTLTRGPSGVRAAVCWAALLLGACASTGTQQQAAPNPIDMQRGWKIYSYAASDALVGVTTLPNAPADSTRPDHLLSVIGEAFCAPVLDEKNDVADARMKDFCRDAAHSSRRVVLAPGWSDEVPSYPDCFIHCVCEGRAPRTEDPAEVTRETKTGPCTNRLNCRLDCPATAPGQAPGS